MLLLVFELKTCVMSDDTLRWPQVKWTMKSISAIAYLVIFYAFYGYCSKTLLLYGIDPLFQLRGEQIIGTESDGPGWM